MPPVRLSMDTVTSFQHQLAKRYDAPLEKVKQWSENSTFQIDALGLVTLLGADEVNLAVGTLQRRRFTEYLPLLAAYVIAGNRFTLEQPGFVIYNLSQGITSTELKGWFSRWLMSQMVENATTVLTWEPKKKPAPGVSLFTSLIAPIFSFILVAPLVVFTFLMGDWYGVGNSAAIVFSIFTRAYLLWELRHARDKAASGSGTKPGENEDQDLFVVRSDGKMITCKAPASVVKTFVKDCPIHRKFYYKQARRIGWLALGGHICVLGMCTLFTQIYTVVLLVLSTWALSSDFGFDIQRKKKDVNGRDVLVIPFNSDWDVIKSNPARDRAKDQRAAGKTLGDWDRRQIAWAHFGPNKEQTDMMNRWNLFPDTANKPWWNAYDSLKNELHPSPDTNEKRSSTPPPQADPVGRPTPAPRTPSTQPLVEPPSTAGTLGSSISSTSTPGGSRSSSPNPAV